MKEKSWNEIRDDILIDACNKIKEKFSLKKGLTTKDETN